MAMRRNPVVEKTCLVCGDVFAGGGGRLQRPADQKYCSNRCSASARIRTPVHQIRRMTDVEAAWLAGLFDGEGSIVELKRGATQMTKAWRITITNTCLPLLDRVEEVTGVHARVFMKRKAPNPKHTQAYFWQAYSTTAAEVLMQMLPYLIVKRERALLVLRQYRPETTLPAGG